MEQHETIRIYIKTADKKQIQNLANTLGISYSEFFRRGAYELIQILKRQTKADFKEWKIKKNWSKND